ncbi:MAG: hypothetical protein KDA79_06660 [Planctomycetaceae bacterium]|nr:hypothetical protein [Planctomycetaceae bacterium]
MLRAIPETAHISAFRRAGASCCAALLLGSLFTVDEAAAAGPPASRLLSRRAAAVVPQQESALPETDLARSSGPPASRLISRANRAPLRLVSHRDEAASAAELDRLRQRSADRRWNAQAGGQQPAQNSGTADPRPSQGNVPAARQELQRTAAAEPVARTRTEYVSESPLPFPGKTAAERELTAESDADAARAPLPEYTVSARLAQRGDDSPAISDYTGSPDDLKQIGDILPFFDYEPDPAVLAEDPCRNLCPRPDGLSCKEFGDSDRMPECPAEVNLGDEHFGGRHLPEGVLAWVAPNITYRPLYYEDPALERYGHTLWGPVQSVVSLARFGVQTAGLPYQASLHPYCKDVYPLGWYRPGECAPKKHYQIPLSGRAAATQAAWMTGLIYLIP